MTKQELIKAAHVRNEQFISELRLIIELLPSICFWQATRIQAKSCEQGPDGDVGGETLRKEVALLKELVDRLERLLDTWPNAVWLFFPETGHTGRIRLFHEFYSRVYPTYFPDAPRALLWRIKRVCGHRRCGIARRIRRESVRTFRMWDQFKTGRKPMEIVRREFPSRTAEWKQRSKKELMAVRRSLERAGQLIYGQPLPRKRKLRRLSGFNHENHIAMCAECRNATTFEKLCQTARDYLNQDQGSFLYNWTSL